MLLSANTKANQVASVALVRAGLSCLSCLLEGDLVFHHLCDVEKVAGNNLCHLLCCGAAPGAAWEHSEDISACFGRTNTVVFVFKQREFPKFFTFRARDKVSWIFLILFSKCWLYPSFMQWLLGSRAVIHYSESGQNLLVSVEKRGFWGGLVWELAVLQFVLCSQHFSNFTAPSAGDCVRSLGWINLNFLSLN